jgi:hypothetical protein
MNNGLGDYRWPPRKKSGRLAAKPAPGPVAHRRRRNGCRPPWRWRWAAAPLP